MCRVIIADDEPKVSLLIKNLIQWDELGLELVAMAGDGIAALALIEQHRPDIVITDIRMPGYDGIELIDRAKQLNPAIDFIIISGYRHFDYAQKAIRFGVEDYLLKPLKAVEINQTLRKMIAKFKERERAKRIEADYSARVESDARNLNDKFMVGLLEAAAEGGPVMLSDGMPAPNLDSLNERFSLGFQSELFQAFVLKADVSFDSFNPNVQKLLVEKSLVAIRESLAPRCHVCLLLPGSQGIYGVVNFSEIQTKPLRRTMATIIDDLQSQSELFDRIKVSLGLGRQSANVLDLPVSIAEAEAAVANRLIYGTGRIIERTGSSDTAGIASQIVTAEVRKRLLQAIEILDEAEARTQLEEIARAIAGFSGMSGKAIGAVFEECIQILRFGLKSQNAVDDWVDAEQAGLVARFAMCSSQKEVFSLLSAYASSLIEHVTARKKSESSKPVREAQKFIQAHFAEPISLESISQQAGFNPTYFSLLFKRETGVNFLEYLTDVRVKEAKRLLSDPSKTVADIAFEVGYSDEKHFSRLFTRITGLQPSKYRKLYY